MLVSDLLAELRNNMLRDVSRLVGGSGDQLWSDTTLYSYINEAYQRFARLTFCIRDMTTASVTQIALRTGVDQYTLDPSILGVYSVKYNTDLFDLGRIGHAALNYYMPPDTTFWDINAVAVLAPGRPMYVSTDESTLRLRVYPTPSPTENGNLLYLRVARLPLVTINATNAALTPDILPEYQLYPLEWAAWRALSNDMIGDEDKIAEKRNVRKANFDMYVDEVKRDIKRRNFAPNAWQFGRNGFAWAR